MTTGPRDRAVAVTATGDTQPTSTVNWGAIAVAVLIGFGITLLLVTVGAAAGAMAEDGDVADGDSGKIAAALGTWTVLAALGGTFVGSYVGGRFTRWTSRGSAIYHALGAWGLSLLLGTWLGAAGATGLIGSALSQQANAPRAQQAVATGAKPEDIADAIGWGGWALAAAMALTMLVSIAAWVWGAHRSLDGFERQPA